MKENGLRALVSRTAESVPGALIAATGLSLSLLTYEAQRMSSFQNVAEGSFILSIPSVLSLILFLFFLFIYRIHPSFRLHRHPFVGVLIAALLAVSSILLSGNGIIPQTELLVLIARTTIRLCELLLLLCWAEVLIPFGARNVAVIFALSLFALGIINALSAFIRVDAAHIFVATFPIISITCLYWFKDHSSSFDLSLIPQEVNARARFDIDRSLMPEDASPSTKTSLLLIFLLPLLCYSFIFGHVHFTWVPTQDGSFVSFMVQVAAALGTFLAGLVLLFLVTHFWGRRKLELYNLFILPVTFLALYLSSLLADSSYSFFYVIPLNIAQKLVFFYIWMTPFLLPSTKSPLFVWCGALSLYQLGKILSTSASGLPGSVFYTGWVILFLILLTAGSIIGILLDRGRGSHEQESPEQASPDKKISGTEYSTVTFNPLATEEKSLSEVAKKCHLVAKEYQLTRREEEILQLLAEGLTAQSIAETLIVSTSTAKSHMRNIYMKLDIHAQNELILLVHKK